MKAVICPRYGSPEVLEFQERPKPQPKPDALLVRVMATSVSVADVRLRGFRMPKGLWLPARLAIGIFRPKIQILGLEFSGVVEAIGKKVQRFQPGDAIFGASVAHFGGYAEYLCISEQEPVALMPENCSFEEAAAIPVGARTAYHFLKKAAPLRGKKVLIYGASGSVGSYAVQLAALQGAEVTAVCSSGNFEWLQAFGASKLIDYRQVNWTDQLEAYDVFFVAVDKCPFDIANAALKEAGTYINITQPIISFAQLRTSWRSSKKIYMGENLSKGPADLLEIKQLVENRKLKPFIDRTYPLEDIIDAHRYVDAGHKRGNVVVDVQAN